MGVHRSLACTCPLGHGVASTPSPRLNSDRSPGMPPPAKCSHPTDTASGAGLAGDQVELVALDVGEGRPASLVRLHVTEPAGAQAQQTLRLGDERVADQVEVKAVLDGLRLRYGVEHDEWRAGIRAVGEQDRVPGSGIFGNLPSEDIGPELGQGQRVGTVNGDSDQRTAHLSSFPLNTSTTAVATDRMVGLRGRTTVRSEIKDLWFAVRRCRLRKKGAGALRPGGKPALWRIQVSCTTREPAAG